MLETSLFHSDKTAVMEPTRVVDLNKCWIHTSLTLMSTKRCTRTKHIFNPSDTAFLDNCVVFKARG